YKVHSYNRNGLCVVGFMDDHYPIRSAFSVLNKRSMQADSTQSWPYLNDALTKFQDPVEADKLLKIQRELDETKIILHKTIDSFLERGKKMDSLVQKSSDLSAASQIYGRLQERVLENVHIHCT
nr:VAMP-like protein YKT61 [Tanacetum cinerariifolium]